MAGNIRLGVIVPSVNTVVEEWYPKVVPEGVSVHFARMLIADGTSTEKIIEMDREDGMRAIRQIASCRPYATAYGCTASSIIQGHAFDERLRSEIRHIAGAPATTATDSIFAACRKLGLKRVTASSPYGRAHPRGKPGFSTLETGCGRETDSPLEGDGFEPSVPPVKGNSFDAARSRTWKRLRRSN